MQSFCRFFGRQFVRYSVITPAYNEADSVEELYNEIGEVLDPLDGGTSAHREHPGESTAP